MNNQTLALNLNTRFNLLRATIIVLCFWLVASFIIGCAGDLSPGDDPTFTTFEVSPESVCVNSGNPTVRVNYKVDPGDVNSTNWGNICIDIKANNKSVHNTWHYACLDDGLTDEYTFNLKDILGSNIPSTVKIEGTLLPRVSGDSYDAVGVTITGDICN